MALNPSYIVAPPLQDYFVDKDTGAPLSDGFLYFYVTGTHDLKNIYQLVDPATNNFQALPNPIILSGVGTIMDISGNDVVPYLYPFDADGNIELYDVVLKNSLGVPQFTRESWPPNVEDISPTPEQNGLHNYIPNGQFWVHTNIVNNNIENQLTTGTNVLAPGGFSFELPGSITSTNTATFNQLQYSGGSIPANPQFECELKCTVAPGSSESIKDLRIKFNNVNTFASSAQTYTLSFMAAAVSNPVTINIYVAKYFGSGGTPSTVQFSALKASQTITVGYPDVPYNFSFVFDENNETTIGPNNDDWVAIDIRLPTTGTFDIKFTDFVLASDTITITSFPQTTTAEYLSQAVAGWLVNPNFNAADLYLPLVLTKSGLDYDTGQIGDILATLSLQPSATDPTADPAPTSNRLNCDGTSYVYAHYSTLGIPFSRLGDFLIQNSPVTNIPMYGTGTNFATAYAFAGTTTTLRLTVNKNGTGIANASDGNTTWTFGGIPVYNGVATGSNSIGYNAYNNVANTILVASTSNGVSPSVNNGTSGFTLTLLNEFTGLIIEPLWAFTVLCTAASTLTNTGAAGKYFSFINNGVTYYVWFHFTNETDPAPGGTGIRVNLLTSYTAQDVANVVREILNAYQSTAITVTGVPTAGQYWLFSSNPGSILNYYVWYTLGTTGTDPNLSSKTGIVVALDSSGETTATVVTKTLQAINQYQYAVPNLQGMFLRGYDANGTWDLDNTQRWSMVSGLSGVHLGTFEFQQLLAHGHTYNVGTVPSGANTSALQNGSSSTLTTANTGGSETRPVNAYVNFVIKY